LNADDPAIPLIRRLQTDYPHLRIDLVCNGIRAFRGPNLKVCNLLAMLPLAQFDLLVLCDSDMRVEPDYVRRVVAAFRPDGTSPSHTLPSVNGVGLVTCPYRGSSVESLPAVLEALGIGADFIPGALVSRAMEGVGFAFGSTIALPRHVLEQIGGFEAILNELADDFRLGESTRAAGYEVVLSDYMVDDVLGAERFVGMWNRRLRWARTVRSCRPWGYAGLFITNGTALGLLFWAAMGFNIVGSTVLVSALSLRLATTAAIGATCTSDRNLIRYLPLLPISDVLSLCLYMASYFGNRIIWRGETFKLLPGGKMEKVTQSS
jgi:ceramide glucosyltransferase